MTAKIFERLSQSFNTILLLGLCLATLGLLGLIFKEEGWQGILGTYRHEVLEVCLKLAFMLIIFFSFTGAINHLYKRHKETFRDIFCGRKGAVTMVVVSSSMVGPAGAKQIHDAWYDPEIRGKDRANIILNLVAMMAMGFTMILFRARFLGGELTLIWLSLAAFLYSVVWFGCQIWLWYCR